MKKFGKKSTVHPTPPFISDHLAFLPAAILTVTAALSQEDKEVLAYLISWSLNSGNISGHFSGNRRSTHKSSPHITSISGVKNFSGENASVSSAVSGGGDSDVLCNISGSGHFSGNRRTTQKSSVNGACIAGKKNFSGERAAVGGGAGGGGGGCGDHEITFNCYCFSCYTRYWVKWDTSSNRQLIHEILDAYEDGLYSRKETSKKKDRKNRTKTSKNQESELKMSSSELNGSGSGSGTGSGHEPVVENSGEDDGGDGDEGTEKGPVRRFVSFLGEKIWWNVWT